MKTKIKSLQRSLTILECFTIEEPELGITDISKKLDMHKSTVFNIINTFEEAGYLEQNQLTSKYRLGLKVMHLGYGIFATNDIRLTLKPYLQDISTKTGESVYLGLLVDQEIFYLDTVFPTAFQGAHNIIGLKVPLYCTGIGKALLATLDDETVAIILEKPMDKYTPHTITDAGILWEEIAIIRKQGYSIDNMEHEYGIKCVGIAIRNIRNEAVCALSISGPSLRFDDEKIIEYSIILKDLQAKLKKELF